MVGDIVGVYGRLKLGLDATRVTNDEEPGCPGRRTRLY